MAELNANLLAEYRRLAKRADQRLVRLEAAAKQPGYSNAKKWAYRQAQKDIRRWSGEEATRFNTAPPRTTQELKAKINDMRNFLEAKTSTKSGIKAVYSQSRNSFNQKFGTNYTADSFMKLWDSGMGDLIKSGYGSETGYKSLGVIKANIKKAKDYIDKSDKSIVFEQNDKVVNTLIKDMLDKYGKDILDLFE